MKAQRIYPMMKMFSHERTLRFLHGESIFPINVEFSPSGTCPAHCRKCYYRVDDGKLPGMDGKMFDADRFPSLAEEMVACGVKAITWTGGGDPPAHPKFAQMVRVAHDAGLQQGMFTSALVRVKYDPSLFEWIRVTATDQPLPEEHLKAMRSCKTLGIAINYAPGDEQLIEQALAIIENLERLKTDRSHATYLQLRPEMNILGQPHECSLPLINHPLVEITPKESENRGYTRCRGYHITPFLWQDGELNVCAYHKGRPGYILGNVYDNDFASIMSTAPQTVAVIPECQSCCKLDQMNKAIEEHRLLQDVNFI